MFNGSTDARLQDEARAVIFNLTEGLDVVESYQCCLIYLTQCDLSSKLYQTVKPIFSS